MPRPKRLSDEALRDIVRGACLARQAQGHPRPTWYELCEACRPHGGATSVRVCRMVRFLRETGEIPDEPAGRRDDRAGEDPRAEAPPPRPRRRPEQWRTIVDEHRRRERRLRNGAVLLPGGDHALRNRRLLR